MIKTLLTEQDRPINILVVDDDEEMLALLAAMIEDHLGARAIVQSVADAQAARERLETGLVDVLVTDLQMPELSGLQLLRYAKRRNAWTQVIVVTGHSAIDALTDAMDLGAGDYLVKPVEPVELEQSIREAASRIARWRQSLARTFCAVKGA